jgi:hypothetical protein
VSGMKKDAVFKALYGELWFQGSSYEKLRVAHVDEFDINLELQLPVDYAELKVCILCYVLQQCNISHQSQVYLTMQLVLNSDMWKTSAFCSWKSQFKLVSQLRHQIISTGYSLFMGKKKGPIYLFVLDHATH